MILSLAIIFGACCLWSVWARWADEQDEKAEADADLNVTRDLRIPVDEALEGGRPLGAYAMDALHRRSELVFFNQTWSHYWEVMVAQHPIFNIVFSHEDVSRSTRIWAF